MQQTVQYVVIGGTILLLGSSVACFVVATAIRFYIVTKIGVNDLVRYRTYASSEAPPWLPIAERWFTRLIIAWFLLALARMLFAGIMIKLFSDPKASSKYVIPPISENFEYAINPLIRKDHASE